MIRLQRIGRKNDPHFRVVVIDSRKGPKSGSFIEKLGSFNAKKGDMTLDADRVKHWLKVGAKTSDTMHNFLVSKKIVEGKKINVLSRKRPTKSKKELKAAAK